MLFNSFDFLYFFMLVFPSYWLLANQSVWIRNLFLISFSYIFYGWWDYRFLALIAISSAVDYSVALGIAKSDSTVRRKFLLGVSLCCNLGALGFFKYHDFFLDNLTLLLGQVGLTLDQPTLGIILPLGISFYTLQTLGYTIDVYRKKMEPTRDPLAFFAYVCFFPQLVAGPIERASRLLPQFETAQRFDSSMARDGMRQILWGLFKKVVIADQCGRLSDPIFASYGEQTGATIALAAFYFAIQIYCDFSGYSDMAIGLAKLLGFRLVKNFNRPYFATSVSDFWHRWHMSLSTWLRDYIYIPLGGSRGGQASTFANIFVVFTLSGLWHGAAWNYVLWGWLHFLYLLPGAFARQKSASRYGGDNALVQTFNRISVFVLVTFAWIFFRVQGGANAIECAMAVLNPSLFSIPSCPLTGVGWTIVLFVAEYCQGDRDHPLQLRRWPMPMRWSLYAIIVVVCLGNFRENSPFIYFQF